MSKFFVYAAFGFLILVLTPTVHGQGAQPRFEDRLAIAGLWNAIADAVRKKDRAALERIYSIDFVHVHARGKIDNRKERLDAILSGESTIDAGGEVDFGFRSFGETLIAVGTVKTTGDDGGPVTYAVTKVYAREKGRWMFVSSHASPVVLK